VTHRGKRKLCAVERLPPLCRVAEQQQRRGGKNERRRRRRRRSLDTLKKPEDGKGQRRARERERPIIDELTLSHWTLGHLFLDSVESELVTQAVFVEQLVLGL